MLKYRYTDTEIKKLLKTAIILIDTREQQNEHIKSYLEQKKRPYKTLKLDTGDYSIMLPKNAEMGLQRDLYIQVTIERKNSIDELIGNFKADKRTAFENELIRSQSLDFVLMIEQQDGYKDILTSNYRSQMKPASVIGTLKAFESRYQFNTIFIDKSLSPMWIYHHLYYKARNELQKL